MYYEKIEKISKNIRIARKAKNINQIDISKKLNIERSTYTKYESGLISIPLCMLTKLCNILQEDINNIISAN